MLVHRPQTAAFLRFINGLPRGYIFTTRELIPFAPRSTLDSALSRMVKSGRLERLARGVFRIYDRRNRKVSVRQIAAIKRRAFGRKMSTVATFIDKQDIERLDDRGRELLKPSNHTLISDGRTSSFLFHQDGSRINLKSAAMRINKLGEDAAGRMLRDLWLLGSETITLPDVWEAWDLLTPRDIAKVHALKRFLPDWLVKMLPPTPSHLVEQLMIRPIRKTVFIKPRKRVEEAIKTEPTSLESNQAHKTMQPEEEAEKEERLDESDMQKSDMQESKLKEFKLQENDLQRNDLEQEEEEEEQEEQEEQQQQQQQQLDDDENTNPDLDKID